jgi:hypothetical protein
VGEYLSGTEARNEQSHRRLDAHSYQDLGWVEDIKHVRVIVIVDDGFIRRGSRGRKNASVALEVQRLSELDVSGWRHCKLGGMWATRPLNTVTDTAAR